MPRDTRTAALRKRLYGERNGVVADTMHRLGVRYAENWGVSLPTIRKIARAETPDHAWARELWQSPLRELRITALWLADPARMSTEKEWQEGLTTPELVDELAFVLRVQSVRS